MTMMFEESKEGLCLSRRCW